MLGSTAFPIEEFGLRIGHGDWLLIRSHYFRGPRGTVINPGNQRRDLFTVAEVS